MFNQHLLSYTWSSLTRMVTDWAFLAFIIALPTSMYLFFSGVYGDQVSGSTTVAATMMVTMAAYGGLGAAMAAGNAIQTERSTGWFRQLMLTALRPAQFFSAKVTVALLALAPAIVAVFIAGLVRGVELSAGVWAATFGLLIVALLPMVVLGLVIGLWFKPQAANAATTLLMLALAMLGGLWFPLEMMPTWMQHLGTALPSYWAGQIGLHPIAGGDFPWRGVGVIGAWLVALVGLGLVGYRRAVRTSRR